VGATCGDVSLGAVPVGFGAEGGAYRLDGWDGGDVDCCRVAREDWFDGGMYG